ncbi:MAG: peptide chain release factor N(5)-glutamine methyltransferase [Acidobacteriota bacterium]
MKLSSLYKETLKSGSVNPSDFFILIEKITGITKEKFWAHNDSISLTSDETTLLRTAIIRLQNNEPVSYITGEKEFYSEKFIVNKSVLIPRPETELIIDILLSESDSTTKILEIGAGSGIISILAAKLSGAEVTAVEYDNDALEVLKNNIELHNVKELVTPVSADLFPVKKPKFNIIVTNPPYLSEKDLEQADPAVREHEPRIALLGGENGHEIIEKIIRRAQEYLSYNGKILIEIGYDQRSKVIKLLQIYGYKNIEFYDDLNGIPRVVKATK